MTSPPPIERWAREEALREIVRLARDLADVDADEAWRRLQRLTLEQRAGVTEVLRKMGMDLGAE